MCGAPLDADVVVVGQDDSPGAHDHLEQRASWGSRVGIPVALLSLVGLLALAVFGGDDSTEDVEPPSLLDAPEASSGAEGTPDAATDLAVPAQTRPDEVSAVAELGPPLEWRPGPELGAGRPLLVSEWRGVLMLLAATPTASGGGLTGWASDESLGWRSLGELVPGPASVSSVVAFDEVFWAVGVDAGGDLTVWRSEDALEWTPSRLDAPDPGPGRTLFTVAATSGDGLVVASRAEFDPRKWLSDERPELNGVVDDLGWGWGGEPLRVSIFGPFGIELFGATADDLGVPEPDALTLDPSVASDTSVWVSDDGRSWDLATTLEGTAITSIVEGPDGELLAAGRTGSRSTITLVSVDGGATWDEVAGNGSPASAAAVWGDAVVGVGAFYDDVRVLDDERWRSMGLEQLVGGAENWRVDDVTADARGLVVTATEFQPDSFGVAQPTRAVAINAGHALTAAADAGELIVTDPDGAVVLRTNLYSGRPHPHIVPNLAERTITFNNEATGEPAVTFTIDELTQLERASFGHLTGRTKYSIHYSTDGTTWSAHDLDDIAGPGNHVSNVALTSTQIVIAVQPVAGANGGGPISLWFAARPS